MMRWTPDNRIDLPLSGSSATPGPWLRAVLPLLAVLLFLAACGLRPDDGALISRAIGAAERDDHRAAIIDLKSVLQRNPRNVDARVALGRTYLAVAEPYAAEKELRRAAEFGAPESRILVPLGESLLAQRSFDLVLSEITADKAADAADRIDVLLIRGDAELALGMRNRARQAYVDVLELDAENATAYLGLASTYIDEGQLEQASVSIDRAIELAPELAAAWMARGTFRLTRRMHEAAEGDLQRALELATADSIAAIQQAALAGLTDIYLLQENFESAMASAEQLADLAPDSITSRYTLARVAFATNDIDQAVVLLQAILKDTPDFRRAHLLYGAVSRAKGNLAQAEMYLSSALAHRPDNAEARRLLADVRLRQRKFDDASDALAPMLDEDGADDQLLAAAGVLKIQSGDYREGLELFRRSVTADPDNLDRQMDLAAIHLAVGRVNEAITILESLAGTDVDGQRLDVLNVIGTLRRDDAEAAIAKAQELLAGSPDNDQLHTVLGIMLQSSGNLAEARVSFEHALDIDPSNIAALLRIGQIEAEEFRFNNARMRFRRALQVAPENLPALIEMARLAMREGDVASSVGWLEKARYSNERAIYPRIQLAMQYISQRRHDLALEVAEEAVRIDGNDARARNLLGVAQMATGDFDGAADNFAEARRLDPDAAAYPYNLARAEFKRSDQRAAERIIRENYREHPAHVPTAAQLADYLIRKGDFAAATEIARTLQENQSTLTTGLALHADILVAQDKLAEAVELYDQLLDSRIDRDLAVRAYQVRSKARHSNPFEPINAYLAANPADAAARMFLAESYHANGDLDEAAAEYERLLQANPENVVALNNLAWILLDREDPEAEAVAEAAYALLPDNADIADTYGWVLLKNGKAEKARPVLQKAAESMPDNAEIHYHFGVALLESGNPDAAYAVFERLLASDRNFASRNAATRILQDMQRGQ